MIFSKPRRLSAEVNASSMADIAFLLLVFFLVTTVIDTEKGITVKLPAFDNAPPPLVSRRNVLSVKINFANQLSVEGEVVAIEHLRQQAKVFIMNPNNNPLFAVRPNQAVIALQNDRSTSYATYVAAYNELKGAYNELWEEAAQSRFGQSFSKLSRSRQQSIRDVIPLVISESDLVDLATEEKPDRFFVKN